MARNTSEDTTNFPDDLEKSLLSHANEFLQKVDESEYLSESQIKHLEQLETSELKLSNLLRTIILPVTPACQTNLFELLINFMKNSTDDKLKPLAEKLAEERGVPTVCSQEATEATVPSKDNLVVEAENTATVPTQSSSKHVGLVTSNGTKLSHVESSMKDVANKTRGANLDLEMILKNNVLSKIQISIVTCTGIPKTGKTLFSQLLMKSQLEDSSGDHSTIYIKKRKNISLNEDIKWEKIELNKLIEQFKNYVECKAEFDREEIWSILIILDISVPTPTIDLLPSSIITFITCVCDTKNQEQSIENLEFSSFLNVLMSCNCFKTNPDQNSMFDKLIYKHYMDQKRCYAAFVGVSKNDIPKDVKANVNEEIKGLLDKLAYVREQYPHKIPYPYFFDEDGGLLNSVDIYNPNDTAVEKLFSQMEEQHSQNIIYNIPITWLLLYFQILKICEEKEYVHYKTIFDSVWKAMCLSDDENELKTALSFFHYQEALLYFKDVDGICNYIFKDVRWLFKEIVYLLYELPRKCRRDHDSYIKYKNRGILTKQMIFEVSCNIKSDIKLCDLLKLLVHKKFIAPLRNIEYFIPGRLESFNSQSKTTSKFASLQIKMDSLLVVFTCGSFHRLMFCQLAAYLLNNLPPGWSQPGHSKSQSIFSNLITFSVSGSGGFGRVSFIDRIHFLEIQIHNSSKEKISIEQHLIYRFANEALTNACAELGLNCSDLKFGFLCQSCLSSEEQHIMIMDKSSSKAYCCMTNEQITMLDYHLKWINETPAIIPMQEHTSATSEMNSATNDSKEATVLDQELNEHDGEPITGNKKRHRSGRYKSVPLEKKHEEERCSLSEGAPSKGGSLELTQRNSLQKFSRDIIQRVNPTAILPNLIAKGLVTDAQQDILSNSTQTLSDLKQYLLCNVLLKFPEGSVDKFIECLRETSNYDPHDELLKIIISGNQATAD